MAETPSRKLAVILHADVVGSTNLVQRDETLAHTRIQDVFHRFSETIELYGGATTELRGDALVAEFSRASDAVCAAVAFQTENGKFNDTIEDDIQPQLRVGVAMGEVVIADNTITGESVVLAQRLEQLAESGCVCIQGTAYETVPQRIPFEYESLGEQRVKGFEEPVRAYAVTLKPGEKIPAPESMVASVEIHPELPDKPSIAVLPLTNLSGDSEQDYFADGLTEDIITNLSKFPELFVISRHSTFTYKGKSVSIPQVGRELGVLYVLAGSMQRDRDTVRITVQLIDASTGGNLWGHRYKCDLGGIFAIRDKVTQTIAATVMAGTGPLMKAESDRISAKDPKNFDAYDYLLRGTDCLHRLTESDNASAMEMLEYAIELDPDYALPKERMAWVYLNKCIHDWSEDYKQNLDLALECAQKAKKLDDHAYGTYSVLGMIYLHQRKFERCEAAHNRAYELNENSADVIADRAEALIYLGKPTAAIIELRRAKRLNPFHPPWYSWNLGSAYADAGQYDQAIRILKSVENPEKWIRYELLVCYVRLGRIEEAEDEIKAILLARSDFSLATYAEKMYEMEPYRDAKQIERHIDDLRSTRLPE